MAIEAMTHDKQHYRDSLRHIVRPEKPSERLSASSVPLDDYEALYFQTALIEYASYEAPSEETATIARGYSEYIDMVVRDEGEAYVPLYVHTDEAAAVLAEAVECHPHEQNSLHASLHGRLTAFTTTH